mmetsp:Transcript_90072/g.165273  ORF Transcript_90072/g.165273 Transcript_90072/m.165273 type:complete len:666 (-) Transcript_90072:47-2044(-)
MDINDQLAIVAVGGIGQLSTLKKLLDNIVTCPNEQKYRSISLEALRKRGLTPECLSFLLCLGFVEDGSRLHFHSEPGLNFHQARSAVEELQSQASVAEAVDPKVEIVVDGVKEDKHFKEQHQVRPDEGRNESAIAITTNCAVPDSGWDCQICFTTQESRGWRCPSEHQFCKDCMQHHIDAVAFPRCPQCDYELSLADLEAVGVAPSRVEAFQHGKLCKAVDTLAQAGEMLVRCSSGACPNVVLLPAGHRQQFACNLCNARSFCTMCRQSPYHFHSGCESVQPLREQWLKWVSGGREDYYGRARVAAEDDRRNAALYEGIARHNELEADEGWKAQNCRLCPGCSRPISKVDGCDSMVCGRSYHGGDQQPGCGREFDWGQAAPYVAHVERRALPEMNTERAKLRGRTVFHPFTDCNLCGCSGISGLRFRCIHCPAFDVCSACEPHLANVHEPDHVFEIVFESDFRCPWLPRGTRVRVVRSGDRPPRSLTRSSVNQLEGQFGKVSARRRPPLEGYTVELDLGQGTVNLAMEHLEPVITSRAEAEELLTRTLDEDGEEVLPPPPPVSASPFPDDFESSASEGEEAPIRRPPRRLPPVAPPIRRPRVPHRLSRAGAMAYGSPTQHSDSDFADDSPLSEVEALVPPARRGPYRSVPRGPASIQRNMSRAGQ